MKSLLTILLIGAVVFCVLALYAWFYTWIIRLLDDARRRMQ